uniref:hypothetical protein n=1 Tax=Algoriphagus sp. TaxID=1872435 RepID=UPI0040488EFE
LHASPMITPTVKTGQPHKLSTKVGGIKHNVPCMKYKVQSTKYKVWIRIRTCILLLKDLGASNNFFLILLLLLQY